MDFILDYNEPKQMVDNDLMPNRTSPNALKYITKVKAYLMRFALCKNNCDFSMNWLNRSENYYALLLCKERTPSVSCIQYLLHRKLKRRLLLGLKLIDILRFDHQIVNHGTRSKH